MGRLGQAAVCVVVSGTLLLRQPGWRAWGLVIAGILLVWLVWLVRRIVGRSADLPGNPIHAVLLVPAAILAGHTLNGQYAMIQQSGLGGAVTMSLLTHLGLTSVAVVLVQSFCGTRGSAELIGTLAGLSLGSSVWFCQVLPAETIAPDRHVLGCLSLAGLCLLAAPFFDPESSASQWSFARTSLHRVGVVARLAAVVVVGIGWCRLADWGLSMWTAATGLGGGAAAYFVRTRPAGTLRTMLGVSLWLCVSALLVRHVTTASSWISVLGAGELGPVCEDEFATGAALLGRSAGLLGWGAILFGATGLSVWMLLRRGTEQRAPASVASLWITASILVTCAVLGPSGQVSPSSLAGWAVVWGVGPRLTGFGTRRCPPWIMATVVLLLMLLVDLAADPGLLTQAGVAYGLSDKAMHGVAGFTLAMVLVWWLGSQRGWGGFLAFAVALTAGAAGEVAQRFLSSRNAELADFQAHSAGVGLALLLYLLCLACRGGHRVHGLVRSWSRARSEPPMVLASRFGISLPLTVALSAWVIGTSAHVITAQSVAPPRLLVSDGYVSVPNTNRVVVPGIILGRMRESCKSLYLVDGQGAMRPLLHTTVSNRTRFSFSLSNPIKGTNSMSVSGLPFGPLSHQRQVVRWIGVPEDVPVHVLDARSAVKWSKEHPERFRVLLEALRRRGEVVAVYLGRASDYPSCRDRLGQPPLNLICMVQFAAPESPTSAMRLLHRVLPPGAGKPPVQLLTDDATLGAEARRRLGTLAQTWLISPVPESDPGSKVRPTRFDSIDALLGFLHSRE